MKDPHRVMRVARKSSGRVREIKEPFQDPNDTGATYSEPVDH